jgi:hypothetical protein
LKLTIARAFNALAVAVAVARLASWQALSGLSLYGRCLKQKPTFLMSEHPPKRERNKIERDSSTILFTIKEATERVTTSDRMIISDRTNTTERMKTSKRSNREHEHKRQNDYKRQNEHNRKNEHNRQNESKRQNEHNRQNENKRQNESKQPTEKQATTEKTRPGKGKKTQKKITYI